MDLLVHLETFTAVADERSFSRAAAQTGIAQPLLSRRIKNLEQELGAELFQRSARQVRITDFGARLLPYARDVISRAQQLRDVAAAAQRGAIHTLGVPPGCDPAALARVIREAGRRGLSVDVVEADAADRAAELDARRMACGLRRVPPAGAPLVVALGLAHGPGESRRPRPRQPVHLDTLRPRRGAPAEAAALLLMPEDDRSGSTDRLVHELARSGVAAGRLRRVGSAAAAVAEVLAGTAPLLCDETFARRHGLAWTPLADPRLARGYELALTPGGLVTPGAEDALRGWLMPLLGAAIGATTADATEPPAGRAAPERLAAQA